MKKSLIGAVLILVGILGLWAVEARAAGQAGALMIGDSILSRPSGACNQLNIQGKYYKCLTQSTRFATLFTLPEDIRPADNHRVAFYALGSNDALFWNFPGAPERWYIQFNQHMKRLLNNGHAVALVLPPTLTCRDTSGIREVKIRYAAVVAGHFKRPIRVIDLDWFNYASRTTDCAHPNRELSLELAEYFDNYRIVWEAEL